MRTVVRAVAVVSFCTRGIVALGAQTPVPADVGAPGLAITHVTVIDVAAGRRLVDRTVMIRRNRIASVAPGSTSHVPTNTRRIDGRGKFLIPGLWDMHVHVVDSTWSPMNVPLLVANGITGIRDMGSELRGVLALRDSVRGRLLPAPRVVTAGPIVNGALSDGEDWNLVVHDPAEARRAVDSLAHAGVQFIKAYEYLTRDELAAVIDEARRHGLRVVGHLPIGVDAFDAVRLGFAGMEHLRNIDLACSSRADSLLGVRVAALDSATAARDSAGPASRQNAFAAHVRAPQRVLALRTYDPIRCARLVHAFAVAGVWQTPTLITDHRELGDSAFMYDPILSRFAPPGELADWNRRARAYYEQPAASIERLRAHARWEAALVARLQRAGVGILAGSDPPNPWILPGYALHRELVLLHDAGLTNAQALRTATLNPARYLNATDSLGTVSAGKLADLVLLDADPLTDIHNTTRIRAVVADGRVLDRAALDSLLRIAEQAAHVSRRE